MNNSSLSWAALFISIFGTVFGPIITTAMTNHHENKLRTIDIQQKLAEDYSQNRRVAICSFLSSVGKVLSFGDREDQKSLGHDFFGVYAYISDDLRFRLDSFYKSLVVDQDVAAAQSEFPSIASALSDLLREEPPKYPRLHL